MKVDIFNTDKKYDIIYADPPWAYNDKNCSGAAAAQYETMSLADKPRIELFARQYADGWDCWGNEV